MCAHAWNCWLILVKKVAVARPMSSHEGVHGEISKQAAVNGAAGRNTYTGSLFECLATYARVSVDGGQGPTLVCFTPNRSFCTKTELAIKGCRLTKPGIQALLCKCEAFLPAMT